MKRVLLLFFAFTLFMAIPPLATWFWFPGLLIEKFWVLFVFFSLLTFFLIIFVLYIRSRGKAEASAQAFLAGTTVKLLLCMSIALVYILKFEVNKYYFVLNFFYLYFLNTVFEIYTLLRNLRHQNSGQKTQF